MKIINIFSENAFSTLNNNSPSSSALNFKQFSVYENKTYGVSIEYPSTWNSAPGEGNENNNGAEVLI